MSSQEIARSPPKPPSIEDHERLASIAEKLSQYLTDLIATPHSFDELRLKSHGRILEPLITHLVRTVNNVEILCALLALRGRFSSLHEEDGRHLNETRAFACEVVALRFSLCLPDDEAIDHLLHELPPVTADPDESDDPEASAGQHEGAARNAITHSSDEQTPLLDREYDGAIHESSLNRDPKASEFEAMSSTLEGLNALEVAAVSDAKDFLSAMTIQKVVDALWVGDIVLWNDVSVSASKKPRRHDPKKDDPYCRLRVPRYLKLFEVLFFAVFLILYSLLLVDRNIDRVTAVEAILWVWIAAFSYDEYGQYMDAGLAFYVADFWSLWDFGIILIGLIYFFTRLAGLVSNNDHVGDVAFDILTLEALLLVPRTCSIATLNPFFGPLIPCLKEMTKYAMKFIVLVIVLYLGFLATFTLLARGNFTPLQIFIILVKVFFGSSYLGFDAADQISPVLGPPLMLIFVFLSNILLLTALISLISNSLDEIMNRSRQEYLYNYSVYVLEASTSNRLTYCLPPFNLLSLLSRPLRYFLPSEDMRRFRILMLKISHFPHVIMIRLFEAMSGKAMGQLQAISPTANGSVKRARKMPQSLKLIDSPLRARLNRNSLLAGKSMPERRDTRTQRRSVAGANFIARTASEAALDDRIDQLSKTVERLIAAMPHRADSHQDSDVSQT